MPMKVKYFLISFILSLPFWWAVNSFEKNIQDFVFWSEVRKNSQTFTAQLVQTNQIEEIDNVDHSLKPLRNWEVDDLRLNAKSAISVLIDPGNQNKVLFRKESDKNLPIASLTKLMTALVVLENYDPSWIVKISQNAVTQEGDSGQFKVGETFRVKNLLYPLLIESSNDAAQALSEIMGEKNFIESMNLKAKELGMENTYFANPMGVDPEKMGDSINYSTTEDLVKLTEYLLKKHEILEFISKKEFDLYSPDNVLHHRLYNTNILLGKIPQVIGGKTGWSYKAEGCFLIIMEKPTTNNNNSNTKTENDGYLVNIVLGSQDRFGEMERQIDWLNWAYKW